MKADISWMSDADECPIVQVEGFAKGNTKEDLLEPFRKYGSYAITGPQQFYGMATIYKA